MPRRRRIRRPQRAVTRRAQRAKHFFSRRSLLRSDFRNVQDRRSFLHDDLTSRLIDGRPAEYKVHTPKRRPFKRRPLPHELRFVNPRRVVTCLKRKVRREVLFATKGTGKGSRRRRRRYTAESSIRC